MGLARRFKSYVNLSSSEHKLRRLTSTFAGSTFREYLAMMAESAGGGESDSVATGSSMLLEESL